MRITNYETYLKRIAALRGIPRDELNDDEEALLQQYFNRAIRHIWAVAPWPQNTVVEQRTPVSQYVDFEQAGETEIEHVFAVFDKDPYGTVRANRLAYTITRDGVQLVNETHADDVWVYFRKRCPDFFGDIYDENANYSAADQVYYITTGDFYKCTQATSGTVPTNTAYWSRLEIPFDWLNYIVSSAYADALDGESQNEKAEAQRRAADRTLMDELDILERQQGYVLPTLVNTHLGAYTGV